MRSALVDRVTESNFVQDARIHITARQLTQDELRVLRSLSKTPQGQAEDLSHEALGGLTNPDERGVSGLLKKGCIESVAEREGVGSIFFAATEFGRQIEKALAKLLPILSPDIVPDKKEDEK